MSFLSVRLAGRHRCACAFLKRDFITEIGDRTSILLQALHVALGVTSYFFLGQFVGDAGLAGDTFAFLLPGMALSGCMTTAMVCLSQAVRSSQTAGTLKMMVAAPVSPTAWLAYSGLYPLSRAVTEALLYVAAGIALGFSLNRANIGAVLVVSVTSVLTFGGLGVIAGAFTLAFRSSVPLVSIFISVSWLLGGVFYPPHVLPQTLRAASGWVPMTHATQAMRGAALQGQGIADLAPSLIALMTCAAITLSLGVGGFHMALRRARRHGTLGCS